MFNYENKKDNIVHHIAEFYQKNCKGYKCILMDFHMPEVDGFQATKQIRTFEK